MSGRDRTPGLVGGSLQTCGCSEPLAAESRSDAPVGSLFAPSGQVEAAAGREAAAASTRLDPDTCKVTEGESEKCIVLLPARSGGKLCPEGGRAARIRDLKCFEYLAKQMRSPVFITLTIDRKNFVNEEAGYMMLAAKLPDLMHRLGLRVWGRVYEPQTQSGGGWIHAHIVADLAGSKLSLGGIAKRSWHLWRDAWGVGGCDIKPARSREGVGGYMAKYLTKAWPAVPPWMLESNRHFRLVGFSRRASAVLRDGGLKTHRVAPGARGTRRRHRRRPARALIDRLAWSGMTCNAFERTIHVGVAEPRYRFLAGVPIAFGVLRDSGLDGLTVRVAQVGQRVRPVVELDAEWRLTRLRDSKVPVVLVDTTRALAAVARDLVWSKSTSCFRPTGIDDA